MIINSNLLKRASVHILHISSDLIREIIFVAKTNHASNEIQSINNVI
jgi:hypothetical protein